MLRKIFNGESRGWFIATGIYPFILFAIYQDTKNKMSTLDFTIASLFGAIMVIVLIHIKNKIWHIITQRVSPELKDKLNDIFW